MHTIYLYLISESSQKRAVLVLMRKLQTRHIHI